MNRAIIRGRTLTFKRRPDSVNDTGSYSFIEDGALLVENGIIANYGLLSGTPCQLSPNDIIFRNISLRGVWLTQWLRGRDSTDQIRQSVYDELRSYIVDGRLFIKVEATYPLDQVKDAVAHAMREGRNGKVVLLPNA